MLRKILAMGWLSLMVGIYASVGLAYEVQDVMQGGTIAGRVAFTGTPPVARHFEVQKGPEICGPERTLTKVDVKDGWLNGAVVVLEGVESGKPFTSQRFKSPAPGEGEFQYAGREALHLKVELEKCSFGPFTGVVMADTPVRFANHDGIKHTLHSYVLKGRHATILKTVHNQNLSPDSHTEKMFQSGTLRHARAVALTCDRHDFMENWLYVIESPYFAITDLDGTFALDQVPPGTYDLVVWHPVLGMERQTVRVGPNGHVDADFSLGKK